VDLCCGGVVWCDVMMWLGGGGYGGVGVFFGGFPGNGELGVVDDEGGVSGDGGGGDCGCLRCVGCWVVGKRIGGWDCFEGAPPCSEELPRIQILQQHIGDLGAMAFLGPYNVTALGTSVLVGGAVKRRIT